MKGPRVMWNTVPYLFMALIINFAIFQVLVLHLIYNKLDYITWFFTCKPFSSSFFGVVNTVF